MKGTLPATGTAKNTKAGFLAAAMSFVIWGSLPPYWKELGHVSATLILSHRVVWCAALTLLFVVLQGRLGELTRPFSKRDSAVGIVTSAAFLGINWFVFVWAVQAERITECGMGYYINPLVNMLLGRVFFGERLRSPQKAAVVLAILGVGVLAIANKGIPWVALVLPGAFGIYGAMRKKSSVDALPGLAIESTLLAVPSIIIMAKYSLTSSAPPWTDDTHTALFLLGAGVVTAAPLFLFSYGVRHQTLTTVGFLQFMAPTCMLVMAVFLYNEPFTIIHAAAFALIWVGIFLFLSDSIKKLRNSGN